MRICKSQDPRISERSELGDVQWQSQPLAAAGSQSRRSWLAGGLAAAAVFGFVRDARAGAGIRVVTTVPDLGALAREVGGARVRVDVLAAPSEDPHFVDPRPNLLVPLSRADLLVDVGMELEVGWLPPLVLNSRNRSIQPGGKGRFDASTVLKRRLGVPDRVDRSQGDVHASGNPHYLLDPRSAQPIVKELGRRFAALEPKHAQAHLARATGLAGELEQFAGEQRGRFARLAAQRRKVISYHDSLPYLLDWLGLRSVATLEPRPGVPPTPKHVAHLLGHMRGQGVGVIVQESYHPTNTSQALARMAKAELVVFPGGTKFSAGQSYIGHLRQICDALFKAL